MANTKTSTLTAERLREVLDYDPDTGIFTWKYRPELVGSLNATNTLRAGKTAGSVTHRYIQIMINKKMHYAHRLAWMYINGDFEDGEIDHINGNKHDNRIENLRLVNRSQNNQNRSVLSKNLSGFLGVSWHKATGLWRARGALGEHDRVLGYFSTPEEAASVAQKWREENFSHYTGRATPRGEA